MALNIFNLAHAYINSDLNLVKGRSTKEQIFDGERETRYSFSSKWEQYQKSEKFLSFEAGHVLWEEVKVIKTGMKQEEKVVSTLEKNKSPVKNGVGEFLCFVQEFSIFLRS